MTSAAEVLVLGGSGFVGRNLCEVLADHGVEFASASRTSGIDVFDTAALVEVIQESVPKYIVNCVAHVGSLSYVSTYPASVITDNLRLVLSVYEAVRQSGCEAVVINPIANCAYPGLGELYREQEFWNGRLHETVDAYGSTRRMLVAVSSAFRRQHSVRSLNFVVPNMYGPYDSADPEKAHALNALVAKFVRAASSSRRVEVWGSGSAVREWLFAGDFGRLILEVVRSADVGYLDNHEIVNLAQCSGFSIRDLVDMISRRFEDDIQVDWDLSRPDGAPRKVMDDTLFRTLFPDFEFTDLEAGISKTARYYRSLPDWG